MSSNIKYIGLDVHKEAIVIAVLNGAGKLVMESIIETKAVTRVQFLQDCASRRAPPRRAVLSTSGWTAGFAPPGAK
jgi:hypothetical protein